MRILHLSDTHYGADSSALPEQVPAPADRLDRVLAGLPDLSIDIVVHSGDITDGGSKSDALELRDHLSRLRAPILAVPGNHDDPTVVREVFGDPVAELGPWRIVGVDSTLEGLTEGTAGRVAATVDRYDKRPTIAVMHHPARSRSTHDWFRLRDAEPLSDQLAQRAHIRALLTGHTHERFALTESWGLRHLGAPATYYGMAHTGPTFEYRLADIGAQLLSITDDAIGSVLAI